MEAIILCPEEEMFKAAATHPTVPLLDKLQQQGRMGDRCLPSTPGTKDTPTGVSPTPHASELSSACVR